MRRYASLLKTLYFIELLRVLRKNYSLNELSNATKESPTSLSRYIHGHVLPNIRKVEALIPILEKLARIDLMVLSKIRDDAKTGFIDNQSIITDIQLLKLISMSFANRYINRVDVVISPAVDGIPFGALLAEYLGVNLIIVKNKREVGVSQFIEGTHITEDGRIETFYMPRRLLKKNYRVLIADDILRTGETHSTIIDMVNKAKAKVESIVIIMALGDKWRTRLSDVKVDYLIKL